MPGLYVLIATRTDGEILTAAKYNADEQNHIDNQELQKTDDFSTSVGQMQTNTDPGEVGTESLATDASGELSRLRFAIKEVKDALGTAVAQWYSTPPTISGLVATQGVRNLTFNGDFEDWRTGTAVAPFGWTLSGAGATVARDATNFKTTTHSASLTRVGSDALLQRDCIAAAGGQAFIRSRAYRFSAWVRATVAARVRLRINDGVGSTFSSYHTGGGVFERLSVTRVLDGAATALNVGLSVDTGDTNGQIDTASLTEGAAEAAFAPRPTDLTYTNIARYTASGTFIVPPGVTLVRVVLTGGGGGGGGGQAAAAGSSSPAGGGGCSGEVKVQDLITTPGASITVTVGAGGTSGAGGTPPNGGGANGGGGGNSAFDTILGGGGAAGTGASGGTNGVGGISLHGGAGGTPTGAGGAGQAARGNSNNGGDGGLGTPGSPGNGAGGGAGGSVSLGDGGNGGNANGGAGASGEVNTGAGAGGGAGTTGAASGGAGGTGGSGMIVVMW